MEKAGYKPGKVLDLSTFISHFKEKWRSVGFKGFCTYPANRPEGWLDTCMESEVPKAPFWRNLGITFTDREVLNAPSHRVIKRVKHPVVALDCAPAKYPALEQHDKYAKFLFWADPIVKEAKAFIAERLPRPYVAIHLRQAFFPSCERGMTHSSQQCLPWLPDVRAAARSGAPVYPLSVCTGDGASGIEQAVTRVVRSLGGTLLTEGRKAGRWSGVSVFLASDHPVGGDLSFLEDKFNVQTVKGGLNDHSSGFMRPQLDLALLDMADHMLGHCPSSFSHVASRMRLARGGAQGGAPVSFIGVPDSLPPEPDAAKEL